MVSVRSKECICTSKFETFSEGPSLRKKNLVRFIKFPTVYNLSGRRADRLRLYRFLEAIFSALLDLNPVPDTIRLIVNHFSRFLLVKIDNIDKKYRLKSWLRYENLRKEHYCFQMTSIRFECLDRCLGIEIDLTVQNS